MNKVLIVFWFLGWYSIIYLKEAKDYRLKQIQFNEFNNDFYSTEFPFPIVQIEFDKWLREMRTDPIPPFSCILSYQAHITHTQASKEEIKSCPTG